MTQSKQLFVPKKELVIPGDVQPPTPEEVRNNYLFVTNSGDMLLMQGVMVANQTFAGIKDDPAPNTPIKLLVPLASLAFAKEITDKEYTDLMSANQMSNARELSGQSMGSA